jgi:hypothetical protein
MEKPPLQSKFFPAKISFTKIQKKNLAGKNLLRKRVNFTLQRNEVYSLLVFQNQI